MKIEIELDEEHNMEERENLRSAQWALTWVLQELLRQDEQQRIVRQELDKQMRDGKWTRGQYREMRRALNEARELADRTRREVVKMMKEIREEQQNGTAAGDSGDAEQHPGTQV